MYLTPPSLPLPPVFFLITPIVSQLEAQDVELDAGGGQGTAVDLEVTRNEERRGLQGAARKIRLMQCVL